MCSVHLFISITFYNWVKQNLQTLNINYILKKKNTSSKMRFQSVVGQNRNSLSRKKNRAMQNSNTAQNHMKIVFK
jgi:hypothetical protein